MSDNTRSRFVPGSPISHIPTDNPADLPSQGIALCLSGGGYRAMVFALGALKRLNEFGLLRKLKRVSSVSGGSITSAMLGLKWRNLDFNANGVATNFDQEVLIPIRQLASTTIDLPSVLGGGLLPGSANEWIAAKYAKHLFGNSTLKDLPSDDAGPRFVINATNVQTGALWRFSRPYMGDYLVGLVPNPSVRLADAVGASSAFPPVLSPAVFELDPKSFTPDPKAPLQQEPYTRRVVLTDGGVYDNMGIETAWKRYATVLVSDAGAKTLSEPEPKEDWARHANRVLELVDNQVRCLRKRHIIDAFIKGDRKGTYWGIRTDIADYGLPTALPAPHERTLELAAIPTRLKAIDGVIQERLINWSYAVCDAALRRHLPLELPTIPPAPAFPYPQTGV